MKEYDYQILYFNLGNNSDSIKNIEKMEEKFKDIGKYGWELVEIIARDNGQNIISIFKREMDIEEIEVEEILLLEDFMEYIRTGREMEIKFNGKEYTLSRANGEYIFTDVREKNYSIYDSYEALLKSIRIENFTIEDIVDKMLYQDWFIY